MSEEQFWMVWSPAGGVPTYQHFTQSAAVAEAERLARKCPGRPFYVMHAIEARVVNDMQRIKLQPGEVPF